MEIERQTIKYYHMYLLRNIKLVGYVANNLGTRKLTFGKSQPYKLSLT